MISVIIVTYNTGALIRECLSNLTAGTDLLEIIVVDNASSDGTPEIVAQEFPGVTLLRNETNRGFGAANNQGFSIARGDYFVLVNPDLVIVEQSIQQMVDYLRSHPEVGIVGPRTLTAEGQVTITARPDYNSLRVVAKHLSIDVWLPALIYGDYLQKNQTATEPFEAAWLQGSCLVLPRAVCERIGGFDEDFFLYVEDTDLCERIKAAGWRVMFLPTVTVKHYGSTSTSRFPLVRVRSYHLSPLHYFRKRRQHGAVWLLKVGFTIELILKMSVRLLSRRKLEQARAEWQVLQHLWRH